MVGSSRRCYAGMKGGLLRKLWVMRMVQPKAGAGRADSGVVAVYGRHTDMPEAPHPQNEPERLRALWSLNVLDSGTEEAFDRVTRLATSIFDAPICAVSLVDSDREWFKACVGTDTRQGGRKLAFCAHAILSDEVMVVEDTLEDERFVDNPQVTEAGIRFYAGAPLRTRDGLNVGALCIKDTEPRAFSKRDRQVLTDLASIVMDEFELRLGAARQEALRQQAERANAAKAVFLMNISHEVRTPLTAIMGFAEMLNDNDLDADERSLLADRVHANGEQLVKTFDNVLDLARLESGDIQIHEQEVVVRDVIDAVVDPWKHAANEKGLTLQDEITSTAPPTVSVDGWRCQQVLQMLVENAVKFTKKGTISVKASGGHDGSLVVTIQDTGPGMSPQLIKQAGDAFHQGDSSMSRTHEGVGVGLAIVRRLVSLMGGTIDFSSQVGVGTSVRVSFGRAPDAMQYGLRRAG